MIVMPAKFEAGAHIRSITFKVTIVKRKMDEKRKKTVFLVESGKLNVHLGCFEQNL